MPLQMRIDNGDFMALYQSPEMQAYAKRATRKIANECNREDAISEAWADILELRPIDEKDAKRVMDNAIKRFWRKMIATESREVYLSEANDIADSREWGN